MRNIRFPSFVPVAASAIAARDAKRNEGQEEQEIRIPFAPAEYQPVLGDDK
jgi:hypothetical protein